MLHPPLYVPESVSTTQLLENFRRARLQFALIVDEYGEVQGLVTLTDVLAAFAEVRNFSEKLAASPRAEEEGYTEENAVAQDAELLRVSTNLLQVIQIRFDMQTSQTSFLASRLADLVNKDYELMLSSGRDFSAYHQELYQTTGQAMVDGMIRMSNGNPAQVDKDLDMAMRLMGEQFVTGETISEALANARKFEEVELAVKGETDEELATSLVAEMLRTGLTARASGCNAACRLTRSSVSSLGKGT